MCQPKSRDGRRCAAHTRPGYLAALAALGGPMSRRELAAAQVDGMEAIARHASTPTGRKETRRRRAQAETAGDEHMMSTRSHGLCTTRADAG